MFDTVQSQTNVVEEKIVYNGIHVQQATFKAGLAARVHRWFRLTPSFGPDLVREMLSALKCKPDDIILDPFAGAGTTLIESQLEGLTAYGFEINPVLHFVGNTSLDWTFEPSDLQVTLGLICQRYEALEGQVTFDNLASYGLSIPNIHNPTRWWRPDVLKQLLVLKSCIDSLSPTERVRSFFRLALAGVLLPDLTNVTLGRLQLHFIDRTDDDIQVLRTFNTHAESMIDDVKKLKGLNLRHTSKVFFANTTNPCGVKINAPVNCVVTSPPYPNRYSYVWNTRPHLYLFGFLTNAKQASDLDKSTIGGTWGTATSILSKGVVAAEHPVINDVVGRDVEAIRESDNLMANYAMKYFNLLARQLKAMDKFLAPDARLAYVIGCSRLKGVYIETDVLLAKIMEGLGLNYKVSSIERIRKRNSGKDLHESIVYAWKRPN